MSSQDLFQSLFKSYCEQLNYDCLEKHEHIQMTGSFLGRLIYPIISNLSDRSLGFAGKFVEKMRCVSAQAWIQHEIQRREYADKQNRAAIQINNCKSIIQSQISTQQQDLLHFNPLQGDTVNLKHKLRQFNFYVDQNQLITGVVLLALRKEKDHVPALQQRLFGENPAPQEIAVLHTALQDLKKANLSKELATYVLMNPKDYSEEDVISVKQWLLTNSKLVVENDREFTITSCVLSLLKETSLDVQIRASLSAEVEARVKAEKIANLLVGFNGLVDSLQESDLTVKKQQALATVFTKSLEVYDSFSEEDRNEFIRIFDKLNGFNGKILHNILSKDYKAFTKAYNAVATKLGRGMLQIKMDISQDEHLVKQLQEREDAAIAAQLQREIR